MEKRLLIAAALAAVLLIVLLLQSDLFAQRVGLLRPNNPVLVALGENVYRDNCASCHGTELEGQPNWRRPGPDGLLPAPPHDETGHTWHHADDVLFGITKYGFAEFAGLKDHQTSMPAYEDVLSDSEIIAALSFIKAQWPQEIRQRHDPLNEQARSVVVIRCREPGGARTTARAAAGRSIAAAG